MNIRLAHLNLFFSLAASSSALAQQASITGTVTDPDQSLVVQAQVTLDNAQTHLATSTDKSGAYLFSSIPAGTYRLVAQKRGFAPVTVGVVTVSANQPVTQNLTFTRCDANTSITVSAGTTGPPDTLVPQATVDLGPAGAQKPPVNRILETPRSTNSLIRRRQSEMLSSSYCAPNSPVRQ